MEKEKFYCHQAASQAPNTKGEVDEIFCLTKCQSPQKGVKAECPDKVKETLITGTVKKNEGELPPC